MTVVAAQTSRCSTARPSPQRNSWRHRAIRIAAGTQGALGHQTAIDCVGLGLPVLELQPLGSGTAGLLSATETACASLYSHICESLFDAGWALVDLGVPASASIWKAAKDDAEQLWKYMQAGRLSARDGAVVEGLSPSGVARGDRYIPLSVAARYRDSPALCLLDKAMATVGCQLAAALQQMTGRPLGTRTDPFLARFPGDGSHYGAHYDGGGNTGRLTMILYANEEWTEADGGALELLDTAHGCWRSVLPLAGRLILFRADDVLHRVAPVYRPRIALTAWWDFASGSEHAAGTAPGRRGVALLRSAFAAGDERRREVLQLREGDAARLLDSLCA